MVWVKHKRRPGRPATGRQPLLAFRLPSEVIDYIDRTGADRGMHRSAFVRFLLNEGLRALARKDRARRREERREERRATSEPLTAPPEPPPVIASPRARRTWRGRPLTAEEVKAAVERAERGKV